MLVKNKYEMEINNKNHKKLNRRHFLTLGALAISSVFASKRMLHAAPLNYRKNRILEQQYLVGVCDWMILKRQKLGAFELSDKIGVDGVEVDMGGLGDRKTFDNKLTDPSARQEFLDAASSHHLQICSLAMSAFYAQSFAERA